MDHSKQEWRSPKEVAAELGFSVKSIQRFCRQNLVPAKKFGRRRWLINAEALRRLLDLPERR